MCEKKREKERVLFRLWAYDACVDGRIAILFTFQLDDLGKREIANGEIETERASERERET